jgi:hypothetical protein
LFSHCTISARFIILRWLISHALAASSVGNCLTIGGPPSEGGIAAWYDSPTRVISKVLMTIVILPG